VILIEPLTRGDPMSPLRWTCRAMAKLAGVGFSRGGLMIAWPAVGCKPWKC
jgi:hypothetical protein